MFSFESLNLMMHELSSELSEKNLFFSPYSVALGLCALISVTSGENSSKPTVEQLAAALKLPNAKSSKETLKCDRNFRSAWRTATGDAEVRVANHLFAAPGMLDPKLLALRQRLFGASELSVGEDLVFARLKINSWVRCVCDSKIRRIKEWVRPDARAVLVNANYFKVEWPNTLRWRRSAVKEDFRAEDGSAERVYMMRCTANLGFYEDERMLCVRVPYIEHGDVAMFLFLPRIPSLSPSAFVEQLSMEEMEVVMGRCGVRCVDLTLPLFTLRSECDLTDVLKRAGVVVDLSSDDSSNNATAKILQKSVIEFQPGSTTKQKPDDGESCGDDGEIGYSYGDFDISSAFTCNRPFAFTIVHQFDNTLLFFGKVSKVSR